MHRVYVWCVSPTQLAFSPAQTAQALLQDVRGLEERNTTQLHLGSPVPNFLPAMWLPCGLGVPLRGPWLERACEDLTDVCVQ